MENKKDILGQILYADAEPSQKAIYYCVKCKERHATKREAILCCRIRPSRQIICGHCNKKHSTVDEAVNCCFDKKYLVI